MDEFRVIGKPLVKVDAVPKSTGEAVYVDDVKLPRMLYGAILRSPHAHAAIRGIDTSAADLPNRFISFRSAREYQDKYVLAREKGVIPEKK